MNITAGLANVLYWLGMAFNRDTDLRIYVVADRLLRGRNRIAVETL